MIFKRNALLYGEPKIDRLRSRFEIKAFSSHLFLLVLGSLALATSPAFSEVTLSVGPNVNMTRSSANNVEETIAINPHAPNNLFASETWSLAAKYSLDGGLTWSNSNVSALPNSAGDVSAAFDTFGNLFLTRFGNSTRVAVGLSTNGGASFSLLFQTSSPNNDQPTITTGPSSTPGLGSVWLTYTDSSSRLVAQGATVTNLGIVGPFGAVQIADSLGDFGDIVVGPSGQVMVAYQDPNSGVGPDSIRVNLDPDGLGPSGFNPTIVATSTQVGGFSPIPAQPNRTIDAEVGLAWDRSPGPHHGRIHLVYTDRASTSSDDTDIFTRFSDDLGTNWSAALRVNDDPVGNGKSQFLPKIALDQASGMVAVSFYDCRNSVSNEMAEVWASVSIDGGLSFLPNVKVSAGASSSLGSGVSSFNFGDYSGLSFHGGSFYPCWADNSNSTGDNPSGAFNYFDLYTARVTVVAPLVLLNPRFTNNLFAASIQTLPGKTYFLESTPSLSPASWVSGTGVAGDGTLKDMIDPSASGPNTYYRVRAQ